MQRSTKICLLNATSGEYINEAPLNLLYLISHLFDKKIVEESDIKIIDTVLDDPVNFVDRFHADVVGISVITPFFPLAHGIATKLRARFPSLVIVIGGYHISSLPTSLAQPFDYGVIGEGEETFAELIQLLQKTNRPSTRQLKKIAGLSFIDRQSAKVVVTPARKAMLLLNAPQLPWHLVPPERIFQYQLQPVDYKPRILKSVRMYTSRGCPYNCSFCAHRVVWKGVRFFDVELIGREIEYLYSKLSINSFQIMDDTFAVSKPRLKSLIVELKKRKLLGKVSFHYLFVRANLIDDEFAQLLKEFGAISVFIGIEFGSERMLRFLKDGEQSVEQVKKATLHFQKYDIYVFGSFMLFSPTETTAEMMETYRLAKWFVAQKNALMIGFSVTTPYPGTRVWDMAVRENLLTLGEIDWKDFLMFDINSGSRDMTQVFFFNGLSVAECTKIWQKFSVLYDQLNRRWERTESWRDMQQQVGKLNQRQLYKMLIKRRIQHLFEYPGYYLKRVLSSPRLLLDKLQASGTVFSNAFKESF